MMIWSELPKEIQEKMLHRQQLQGNPKNPKVFENSTNSPKNSGGFDWDDSPEGEKFWHDVLLLDDIKKFYEKYPSKFSIEKSKLIDAFNEFNCDKWRKTIKSLLDENFLLKDSDKISISQEIINLISREATESQKNFVKKIGIILPTEEDFIKDLKEYEDYIASAPASTELEYEKFKIYIRMPVCNSEWTFAAWKLAEKICKSLNYYPSFDKRNAKERFLTLLKR